MSDLATKLADSIVTDKGRAIADRVAGMVQHGLPIDRALAVAAELGRADGRLEGIEAVERRMNAVPVEQRTPGEFPVTQALAQARGLA